MNIKLQKELSTSDNQQTIAKGITLLGSNFDYDYDLANYLDNFVYLFGYPINLTNPNGIYLLKIA